MGSAKEDAEKVLEDMRNFNPGTYAAKVELEKKQYNTWRELYHAADFIVDRFHEAEVDDIRGPFFRERVDELEDCIHKLKELLDKGNTPSL